MYVSVPDVFDGLVKRAVGGRALFTGQVGGFDEVSIPASQPGSGLAAACPPRIGHEGRPVVVVLTIEREVEERLGAVRQAALELVRGRVELYPGYIVDEP